MKHKLKLSFWALGILVLILSNLFVFAPASTASAATGLFDSTKTSTYNFSVYMAFRSCLSGISDTTAINPSTGNMNFLTNTTTVVGFTGTDGGNEDGLTTCAEALNLWKNVAGYSDATAALSDLGFQKGPQSCYSGGPSSQICDDTWIIGNGSKDSILNKQTSIAKSKNISTSLPTWGRYMLAFTALQARCASAPTITGPAQNNTATPTSTKVVTDNTGALTSVDYYGSPSEIVSTFPGQTSDSSCNYLMDVVNDASAGATAFGVAIANDRIDSTINIAETGICDNLGLTGKAKDNCEVDFNGYLKACIDSYYKGNAYASAISRTEPFDVTVVSACVESKAKAGGYNITAEQISSVLSDAQNQATPDDTSTTTSTDPCAVLGNDVPMRWLACALLTAGSGMAATFYNMVQQLLYMPTDTIFSDNFTKTAQSFRIIGMALIIIAGLIMIIAQATGSDLVDAYTIKKVLPKLGIALVGMAIALPLLKFAVNLTNDIGIAAGNVIVNLGGSNAGGAAATIGDNINALFLGLAGVAVAGFVWGWAAITFIGTAALALLIGVVVLAIRQMAIVVLIMIAPLAIAASVLPGTDKLWKFWRSTLLSTLMMFPIIMMFLKAGEFMAGIFGSMASTQSNELFTVLAALVYFAPYFMIPLAFKMAGGLMGNIFGMMNDRGKGLFDRMSKFRGAQAQKRAHHYGGLMYGNALQRRYGAYMALQKRRGIGARLLRGAIGGLNIEAEQSEFNKRRQQESFNQTDNGPDSTIHAHTVNKAFADSKLRAAQEARAKANRTGNSADLAAASEAEREAGRWVKQKTDKNGRVTERQYRAASGSWVHEGAVDDAQRQFGNDWAAYQQHMSYAITKASTSEQKDLLMESFGIAATDRFGMSVDEANSVWKGDGFAQQAKQRDLKHYSFKDDGNGGIAFERNDLAMMQDVDENLGAWEEGSNRGDFFVSMQDAMLKADDTINTLSQKGVLDEKEQAQFDDAKEVIRIGARNAENITHSYGPVAGQTQAGQPIPAGGATGAEMVLQGGSSNAVEQATNFVATARAVAARQGLTYEAPTSNPTKAPNGLQPEDPTRPNAPGSFRGVQRRSNQSGRSNLGAEIPDPGATGRDGGGNRPYVP